MADTTLNISDLERIARHAAAKLGQGIFAHWSVTPMGMLLSAGTERQIQTYMVSWLVLVQVRNPVDLLINKTDQVCDQLMKGEPDG